MRNFDRCKTCGEFAWLDSHKCPPVWLCQMADDDDDYIEIRAHDAEQAAEKFAEQWDADGEYSILRCEGDGYTIIVKESEDAEPQKFAIEAESVPTYHARPA